MSKAPERNTFATHEEYIEALLTRLQRQLVNRWVIAIIGLLIVGAGLSYSVAQNRTTATQAHQTAVQAKAAVAQATVTSRAVAQERAAAITSNCNDQNRRNQNTSARLLTEIQAAVKANPAQKTRILASYQGTKLLINDLVPVQNCKKLLQKETHPPRATHPARAP